METLKNMQHIFVIIGGGTLGGILGAWFMPKIYNFFYERKKAWSLSVYNSSSWGCTGLSRRDGRVLELFGENSIISISELHGRTRYYLLKEFDSYDAAKKFLKESKNANKEGAKIEDAQQNTAIPDAEKIWVCRYDIKTEKEVARDTVNGLRVFDGADYDPRFATTLKVEYSAPSQLEMEKALEGIVASFSKNERE